MSANEQTILVSSTFNFNKAHFLYTIIKTTKSANFITLTASQIRQIR